MNTAGVAVVGYAAILILLALLFARGVGRIVVIVLVLLCSFMLADHIGLVGRFW